MREVHSSEIKPQRRRSERITKSLPVIIRGVDLLGQSFEERSSTLDLSLHGCRYSSKYYLPKDTWITLEALHESGGHNLRARVTWFQRPHTIRELFQVAVELERPANIWGIADLPSDWDFASEPVRSHLNNHFAEAVAGRENPLSRNALIDHMAGPMVEKMANTPSPFIPVSPDVYSSMVAPDNPLLRELNAALERQAKSAAESAAAEATEQVRQTAREEDQKRAASAEEMSRKWQEEFDRTQTAARGNFSEQLSALQAELLLGLKSEIERSSQQIRGLLQEMEEKALFLRSESEAVSTNAAKNFASAQLQMEAAEAARVSHSIGAISSEEFAAREAATQRWSEHLQFEMGLAHAQWNELLQVSLDGGIRRLVEQLTARSGDVLRASEERIAERLTEMRQPLKQAAEEARAALVELKSTLEDEISEARSSLAEIEDVAGRIKEYSKQLEATSHDTVNELHQRLENILDAQTDEMNRRVAALTSEVPESLSAKIDSLGRETIERSVAEADARFNARLERVSELLRDLSAREGQAEESLRLYRERLRQTAESNQREAAVQMGATLSTLRGDFESARKDALTKWVEELDTSGVRASHTAAESIGKASEWFQQEASTRLQVLVEQSLVSTGSSIEAVAEEAAQKFAHQLDTRAAGHVAKIEQQMDGVAAEFAGRIPPQFAEAAETAASSFGQVLSEVSDREVQHFTERSQGVVHERTMELEQFAGGLLGNLESSAGASLLHFREQLASHVETSVANGRSALADEVASGLKDFEAQRDVRQNEWSDNLDRLAADISGKFQERLETAGDAWRVSSVRRLNEQCQNVIESLMRSADQALRDSCSKVFEGLAEQLRARLPNNPGVNSFGSAAGREPDSALSHNQSAT